MDAEAPPPRAQITAASSPVADPKDAFESDCNQGPLPADVLFDGGHHGPIVQLDRSSERLLSSTDRRWIVWDTGAQRQVATGFYPAGALEARSSKAGAQSALTGSLLLVSGSVDTLEVRNAGSGQLLATLRTDRSAHTSGLSLDGSYIYSLSATHLRAWAPDGRILFERAGDYRSAAASPAPSELQLARPADDGGLEVETVDLTGRTVSTLRLEGRFKDWFTDGRHFVLETGPLHQVYTRDGQLVRSLPIAQIAGLRFPPVHTVGGHGDFVWVYREGVDLKNQVQVFRLSEPSWSATFAPQVQTHTGRDGSLAFVDDDLRLVRLDFRASELHTTRHQKPSSWNFSYASDGTGLTVADYSELYDMPVLPELARPRTLGCGGIRSIAASARGRVAITTEKARDVRLLEAGSSAPQLLKKMSGLGVGVSDDGETWFVDGPLRAIAASSGAVVTTWSRSPSARRATYTYAAVSAQGERAARIACERLVGDQPCSVEVSTRAAVPVYEIPSVVNAEAVKFSPSGRRIAVLTSTQDLVFTSAVVTSLVFEEGRLLGRLEGSVSGWMDDDRLLLRKTPAGAVSPERREFHVVEPTGNVLSQLTLDARSAPAVAVTSDHLLTPDTLYRLSDGAVVMREEGAVRSALLGDEVAFSINGRVIRRRFR